MIAERLVAAESRSPRGRSPKRMRRHVPFHHTERDRGFRSRHHQCRPQAEPEAEGQPADCPGVLVQPYAAWSHRSGMTTAEPSRSIATVPSWQLLAEQPERQIQPRQRNQQALVGLHGIADAVVAQLRKGHRGKANASRQPDMAELARWPPAVPGTGFPPLTRAPSTGRKIVSASTPAWQTRDCWPWNRRDRGRIVRDGEAGAGTRIRPEPAYEGEVGAQVGRASDHDGQYRQTGPALEERRPCAPSSRAAGLRDAASLEREANAGAGEQPALGGIVAGERGLESSGPCRTGSRSPRRS